MPMLIKKIVFGLALIGLTATPALTLAETSTAKPQGFCIRASNIKSDVSSKLTELEKNRTEQRTEIFSKLQQRKEDRMDAVDKRRDEIKTDFNSNLDDLNDLAKTAAQKAALATFKATVEKALATRKTAVDAAVNTYRTSLQQLITKRQDAIRSASATLKTSIAVATAKAASDCASGVSADTVRTTLQAAIKAAQDKFKTDIQAVDKIGNQIKDLVLTRNKAVLAASQTFKDTVTQAKVTLKAAFATSPTPPAPATEE